MYRTPFGRICEIISYKKRVGKNISNKDLAKLYKSRGKMSDAEKMSDTYISGAITVWNRALSQDHVMRIVLEAEKMHPSDNPFNSMHTLVSIVERASSKSNIKWAVSAIWDAVQSKTLNVDEISTRTLKDVYNRKGLVDKFIMKFEVRQYMHEWITANLNHVAQDIRVTMEGALAS